MTLVPCPAYFDRDAAAVQAHEAPHDRQAEARSVDRPIIGGLGLKKGSPSLGKSRGEMPIPVSLTEINIDVPSGRTAIVTRPSAGVNFRAFDSRLRRTCLQARLSPTISPTPGAMSRTSSTPGLLGLESDHVAAQGDEFADIERLGKDVEASGLDLRRVEDGVHHRQKMMPGAVDDGRVFALLRRIIRDEGSIRQDF